MKKPKTRFKQRAKEKPPKGALIVDYVSYRLFLPYKHPVDLYNNKELDIICKWCEKTFPADEWRCNRNNWPGHIYFLKESYLTMFLLVWAK